MKVKTLTLASVAGSIALAGGASADFVGLAATSQTLMSSGGASWDVFELYATFDSAADEAVAVGGTPLFPQVLNTGGGGFFQAQVFGAEQNAAVNAFTVGGIPDLALDSFVSIGVRQGFAGTPGLPTIQFFNLTDFNGGAASVTTTNGGWFTAPGEPEAAAVPFPPALAAGQEASTGAGVGSHGVILGQFAVAAGNTFSGDLGQLSVFENGVNRIIDNTSGSTFSFSRPLPAPGALALLGLAGLAGTRRRRA